MGDPAFTGSYGKGILDFCFTYMVSNPAQHCNSFRFGRCGGPLKDMTNCNVNENDVQECRQRLLISENN